MSHEHANPGHGAETYDYAAANQKHFDSEAGTYDVVPYVQDLAKQLATKMVEKYPSLFDKEKTTLLDFACGPGILARELYPHVKTIVGVDISQGMVDQFNMRTSEQGIAPEDMRAIRADLTVEPDALGGNKFDIVMCSAAYHHFDDIAKMTSLLTSYIKPGGSLVVADILKSPQYEWVPSMLEQVKHVVAHREGFTEADMLAFFEGAGLTEFDFAPAATVLVHEHDVAFFLAQGKVPLSG